MLNEDLGGEGTTIKHVLLMLVKFQHMRAVSILDVGALSDLGLKWSGNTNYDTRNPIITDISAESDHPVFPAERIFASGELRMVSGRTLIHFTAEDSNIKILATWISSCKQLCISLATAKLLREYYSPPSHVDAEGNLDATEVCVLQNAKEKLELPPMDARENLAPDYLTDAREKISAEAGYQLVVATGEFFITRRGTSSGGQDAPTTRCS